MRILVLGGTGAMGVHLVRLLAENGHETFVTSRSNYVSRGNVQYIKGNARELKFLKPILNKKWDVIVDFLRYSTEEFRERVDLFLKATSQYIFLSSARVYADCGSLICEESPRLLETSNDKVFLSTDEYSLAKARQEDILKSKKARNWTIVRPYITYSVDRLQLGVLEKEEWLYSAIKGRAIVISREILEKRTTLTYGLDVSKTIFRFIGLQSALGNVFQIASEETCLWSDVLELYMEVLESHLGYRPKVILQDLDSFLEWRTSKYQVLYDRLYNRRFSAKRISRYVDLNSFTKVNTGLRDCLVTFLQDPNFNADAINWKREALKDLVSGQKTPLKEIPGYKEKIKYFLYRHGIKKFLAIFHC